MRFGVERGPSYALEILGRQAEVGQDFLVRNGLSARVGGACLGDVAGLFFAHRLVVHRGVGQGDGDRIEHRFEQANNGEDLASRQAIDEFVGLLASGWLRREPCADTIAKSEGLNRVRKKACASPEGTAEILRSYSSAVPDGTVPSAYV